MNILLIKHVVVGFMVYEIPRVSVFGYFPLPIGNYNYSLHNYYFNSIISTI